MSVGNDIFYSRPKISILSKVCTLQRTVLHIKLSKFSEGVNVRSAAAPLPKKHDGGLYEKRLHIPTCFPFICRSFSAEGCETLFTKGLQYDSIIYKKIVIIGAIL